MLKASCTSKSHKLCRGFSQCCVSLKEAFLCLAGGRLDAKLCKLFSFVNARLIHVDLLNKELSLRNRRDRFPDRAFIRKQSNKYAFSLSAAQRPVSFPRAVRNKPCRSSFFSKYKATALKSFLIHFYGKVKQV